MRHSTRASITLVAILAACHGSGADDEASSADPASTSKAAAMSNGGLEEDWALDTVATGLEVPWAMAFAADGRIFVTERAGRIRVIRAGTLEAEPWATLPVRAVGEAGLMGIALAPDFATSHALYVVGTFETNGRLENRVLRLVERNGRGGAPQTIVDHIPAAQFHAGDAIAFGPDGMLYVATGDAREPGSAQDTSSLSGKILRFTPSGGIPADNPARGSPIFARGLRNVQGLAWDPSTRQLFATEHGPSGFPNERFRRNNDELNAIRSGGNYGWPSVAGMGGGNRFIEPIVAWNPGIAPSGLAVYSGNELPSWRGNLFVGALRGEQLRRIVVARDQSASSGWRATSQSALVEGIGRIRAVAYAPDGHLYFSTSNRDGRGAPRAGDDKVLRLRRRQ